MLTVIRAIISEKSFAEAKIGRYTFLVKKTANKTQIAAAIEEQFKVKVIGVMTSLIKAKKNIRSKRRIKTVEKTYKKARIKLAKGQKIDIFDEPKKEDKKK